MLDLNNPRGVHVEAHSYVASGAVIRAHDMRRGPRTGSYIGERCSIAARSIIGTLFRVGDGSIVGAGNVVTRDVPPGLDRRREPGESVALGHSDDAGRARIQSAGYPAQEDS